MSNVQINEGSDAGPRIDTFSRTEGAETVHMQAIVPVDPADGSPLDLATENTLAALKAAIDALSAKITACNTGSVAGTVALDAPTLAALESITAAISGSVSVSNFPATQPVSLASAPLPPGASTEATLAALKGVADTINVAAEAIKTAVEALNTKATVINTGSIAGTVGLDAASLSALETVSVANFPVVQDVDTGLSQGLTDAQLRASAVPVELADLPLPSGAATDATAQAINDLSETIAYMLASILEKMARVDAADRMAITIESGSVGLSSNQTLATVTTVGNQTNLGGRDVAHAAFALANVGALHIYDKIQVD